MHYFLISFVVVAGDVSYLDYLWMHCFCPHIDIQDVTFVSVSLVLLIELFLEPEINNLGDAY